MKSFFTIVFLILLSLPAFAADKETSYDRVMRTGTLRCGYTSWDPLFYIDSVTGEKKGIFHDLTEEIGKRLGLKVVWQEEIGWGTIVEAVKTGRVDMACAGYWLNSGRIKNVSSSAPQFYSPIYMWGRQDDTRLFKTLDDLNSNQFTIAAIDGSAESQAINQRFPKIKIQTFPELATNSDELQALATKKVDFLVMDNASAAAYIAHNPGKIRSVLPHQPIVLFPNVMLLPPKDPQFKEMIDDTLRNVEYDGTLDVILKTYKTQDNFLRNPRPVKLAP